MCPPPADSKRLWFIEDEAGGAIGTPLLSDYTSLSHPISPFSPMDHYFKELPRGTTIYTILRGVSKTGMTRYVDAFVIVRGQPLWVTIPVRHTTKAGCYVLRGCGYDVGYDLVSSIGQALHGDTSWFHQRWL